MKSLTVAFLAVWIAGAVSGAQPIDKQLQPVMKGELTEGTQSFTVRATAGVLLFGTFELQGISRGTRVALGLYLANDVKVQELIADYSMEWSFGFVVPTNGAYRIRITSPPTSRGSFVLKTKQQTPRERTSGITVLPTVRFESPRIVQLAQDVASGKPRSVDKFWTETQARGSPLVESIKDDEKNILVTFLWRETYPTYNVLLDWPGPAPADYYMSRVPKTDVWYKTLQLRRGSRFSYMLVPNDRPGETQYTSQLDPVNPQVLFDRSVLVTPSGPDESWFLRTPTVLGAIAQHNIDSALLKKSREISVYTPPGYSASNGPYPLLILFDGAAYLSPELGAPNTLNNLINEKRIRPTVVCFVSDARGIPAEQQPVYREAMATELLPWLRSTYAVTTNPKDVVVGGYSAGGGMAGMVALSYPSLFGNVLLQSGGSGVLVPALLDSPKLPLRFYIDMGLYEYGPWPYLSPDEQGVDGWFEENVPTQGQNWLQRMRLLRTVLLAKGYDLTYHETPTAHEFLHWRATLADGLSTLLGS